MTGCLQAKDFIQTREGLVFAVVDQELEEGKVLCFLRYIVQHGNWKKLPTQQANDFLQSHYPQYLFYSHIKSAYLHAVAFADIDVHHRPVQRLQDILAKQNPDKVEQDCISLCHIFAKQNVDIRQMGVTGSLLLGAQKQNSDIDLVMYNRQAFHQLRVVVQKLIHLTQLESLNESAWQEAYQRRSCDLSYQDYVWHEQRKFNKGLINQRKFDLNLLVKNTAQEQDVRYQKLGHRVIQAVVTDVQYAFDYPARYVIRHAQITELVCYTATYIGQAEVGETVQAAGQLERSSSGEMRILVGSTREAEGEYIKVLTERCTD